MLNPNAAQQQMEGISDLPAADGLAMLAAVTPAPNERKKEVKSTRSTNTGAQYMRIRCGVAAPLLFT